MIVDKEPLTKDELIESMHRTIVVSSKTLEAMTRDFESTMRSAYMNGFTHGVITVMCLIIIKQLFF